MSGILAYGFSRMHGLHGHAGWRWIFIMQGVLSFTVGLLCWIFVVDFPDKAHKAWGFLNERECAFILRRLDRDRGDASPEPFSLDKFLRPALDLKIWGFALIFFCLTTVAYAIAYFLPIILNENMHFSLAASQCLNAPPYAFAGMLMVITSWAGDKYRVRAPILVLNCIITLVGLSLMGFATSSGVRYSESSSPLPEQMLGFPPRWLTRLTISGDNGQELLPAQPSSALEVSGVLQGAWCFVHKMLRTIYRVSGRRLREFHHLHHILHIGAIVACLIAIHG
ncbi:unnamed protein product [Penicillium egyptiacum]|uniref:Major facilitator superfamily (MFS) profile domain-containing protein n=1 Tax=Penicillium egyptiacum TaxID=1303716 RepID=A0A9W4P4S7_9EURO|nr:unnamed protein product [Penicillium egyptiacum]